MKRMNSTCPRVGQPVGIRCGASGLRGWAMVSSGARPPVAAVAVLVVVEALERARAIAQLRQAAEALLAEEALVKGVVEALDRAVAPRLARGHEHRRGALV